MMLAVGLGASHQLTLVAEPFSAADSRKQVRFLPSQGSWVRTLPGLVAAVLLGVAACGAPAVSQADYPHYDSADALFGTATLVVEAEVAGDSRVTRLSPRLDGGTDPVTNPQAGAPAGEAPDAVVVTVRQARLLTVYKGAAKAGDTVEVKQLGGTLAGVTHETAGEVPLTAGRYVLFLETYPDAPASLLNPYQGQYRVTDAGDLAQVGDNRIPLTRLDLDRLAAGR